MLRFMGIYRFKKKWQLMLKALTNRMVTLLSVLKSSLALKLSASFFFNFNPKFSFAIKSVEFLSIEGKFCVLSYLKWINYLQKGNQPWARDYQLSIRNTIIIKFHPIPMDLLILLCIPRAVLILRRGTKNF